MAQAMVQPSRSAQQKAWALGRKVGAEDPRMRPMVADASDYSTFEKFRAAHRGRLEVKETFAPWDEQIMRIAEREGNRLGFRTDGAANTWDVFLAKVVVPLKNAFWIGWESQIRLDQMYAAARKRAIVSGTLGRSEAKIFPATQVVARVQKPEVEHPGDDAFLVSITESSESPAGLSRTSGVRVLAASRLLERVQKPHVEELGDEVFLMSVTAPPAGAEAAKPGAPVLEASKLVDRVRRPELEQTGDDGFLLSASDDGQEDQNTKRSPGVLAASKLVAAPMASIAPAAADISDADLWGSAPSPSLETPKGANAAVAQTVNQPAAMIDEDIPDLYAV